MIYKALISCLLVCTAAMVCEAQVTLLEEDFSTATGTTPPTGWTIQTTVGDPAVDVWHFDNPGRRSPASPISDPYAVFDSDKYSNNGQAEEVYLVSPAFDATTTDEILLEFDHYFLSGLGGSIAIEVFDGSTWNSIYTNNRTTTNPHHSSFYVADLIQGISNAQIRFKWMGNYSWYWIIDNISVVTEPDNSAFTEISSVMSGTIGKISWADFDNDDDLDALVLGGSSYSAKFFINNGDYSFSEQNQITLPGLNNASADWGDYDNDGHLDILFTGYTGSDYISVIYRNDHGADFIEQTDISLIGVAQGAAEWGDYDNDGDLDILLTGRTINAGVVVTKIYKNNGDNNFIDQTGIKLIGVQDGALAWGDYDNDGFLDILLTGNNQTDYYNYVSKIYHNNGDNTFSELTGISLPGVHRSSCDWGDYDNDGDLDFLLSGSTTASYTGLTKIYRNEGDGTFIENTSSILPAASQGSVDWVDFDNDGDLDFFETGMVDYVTYSWLFENDGNTFTEFTENTITPLRLSSIAWGDFDNDSDQDLFLSGISTVGTSAVTKLYRNNTDLANSLPEIPQNLQSIVSGQNVQFLWDKSSDMQTPADGLSYNLLISDTPGGLNLLSPQANISNGYRKLVSIGNASNNNFYNFRSSLPAGTYYWRVQSLDHSYSGSAFSSQATFEITEVQASYLEFSTISTHNATLSWTRGNKARCAVFVKEDSTGYPMPVDHQTYTPNTAFGLGDMAGDGWYCVYDGTGNSVFVTNLKNTTTYKVAVLEYDGSPGSETYFNVFNTTNPAFFSSQVQFQQYSTYTFPGLSTAAADWGDYDNDGDKDLLLTGYIGTTPTAVLYRNTGISFIEQSTFTLNSISTSSPKWFDYDNDSDLDILMGITSEGNASIYRNDGASGFVEQTDMPFTNAKNSRFDWGDYDNDGDLDFVLTGTKIGGGGVTSIFRNEGDGTFSEQADILLEGVYASSVEWGDYDKDGDLDILLTGGASSGTSTFVYQNQGNNTFTLPSQVDLDGFNYGDGAMGDYDNDGDLDVILTGNSSIGQSTRLYKQIYDHSFSEITNQTLDEISYSTAMWGDYDNDGLLDFLINGSGSGTLVFKVYHNDGDDNFSMQKGADFPTSHSNAPSWVDFDHDGDLDIFIPGLDSSVLYQNNNFVSNQKPSIPVGIIAYISNGKLHISWNKATDAETPQDGLTYNLRVGTTPGGAEIMSPMSLADGTRKIVRRGNVGHNTEWVINLPAVPPDDIYYSIQTVDNGFVGSDWSPESSSMNSLVADFGPTKACQQNEIQFEDRSATSEYPIASYLWRFIDAGEVVDSSTLQHPVFAFQNYTGIQQVELTVTNSNAESVTRTRIMDITPSPLSDFTAPAVCQGVLTQISNLTTANTTTITDWLWDFGDGSPNSVLQDPISHSYNPGSYNMSLTVSADNGCALTTTKEVEVAALPSPVLSISGNSTFCASENTFLSATDDLFYTYQWQNNGALITDSINYRIYPKASGTYSVTINNTVADNCMIESNEVTVVVKAAPPDLSIIKPAGSEFCLNDPASQLSVADVDGLVYNWYVDGNLAASGSNTHIPQQSGTYTLSVSNTENCTRVSSDSVDGLIIMPAPAAPNISHPNPRFCEGGSVELSATNDPTLSYLWFRDGFEVSGATTNEYTADQAGQYQLRATNAGGCSVLSSITEVEVMEVPDAPLISPSSASFCQGKSVELAVSFIDGMSYQWLKEGLAISDASSNTLQVSEPGNYGITVSNAIECEATSLLSVPVTVIDTPAVSVIDKNRPPAFCEGGSVTLSVIDNASWTYQWKKDGYLITDADSHQLTASESGFYYVEARNSDNCVAHSNSQEVREISNPEAPVIAALSDTQFCDGGEVLLSTPQDDMLLYSWKMNGGDLDAHSNEYEATQSGQFTLDILVEGAEECSYAFSNDIGVLVLDNPEKLVIGADETQLCEGDTAHLSVDDVHGLSYRWTRNGVALPGGSGPAYMVTRTGEYDVEMENADACTSMSHKAVSVDVYLKPPVPVISLKEGNADKCPEEMLSLAVDNGSVIYNYTWLKNGLEMNRTGFELSGALDAGEYSVLAWVGTCEEESDRQVITWKSALEKPGIFAYGPELWYLACSNQDASIYRWYHEDILVEESDQHIHVADQKMGRYRVAISDDGACYTSSDVISIPENAILGTEGFDPFAGLNLYPNPSTGLFSLEMDNALMGELTIDIYNETGAQIIRKQFQKETVHFKTEVDLGARPPALYLVRLVLEDYRTTRTLIIHKKSP